MTTVLAAQEITAGRELPSTSGIAGAGREGQGLFCCNGHSSTVVETVVPFLIEEGHKKKRHFVVFFSLNAQDVVLGTIPRCEFSFIHC